VFELMNLGERTAIPQMAFNTREGFAAEDVVLPEKISKPLEGGESDGVSVPADQVDRARALCYQMCGWSKKGMPTGASLEELGIG
jgi:aldehyde:ferredoxin oxidoreductase